MFIYHRVVKGNEKIEVLTKWRKLQEIDYSRSTPYEYAYRSFFYKFKRNKTTQKKNSKKNAYELIFPPLTFFHSHNTTMFFS